MFKKIAENIYKLDIPFDNISTSSFLVVGEWGGILIDSGTYPKDVTDIILPALSKIGIKPNYLFLTHFHADHSGGAETLIKEIKDLKILCFDAKLAEKSSGILLKNNEELFKNIQFLSLPGHSFDSGALLDRRTNSIITGDCLQLWGITKYGCGIGSPIEYKKSIARLKNIKLDNLFASHEYYPLGSRAVGAENVKKYLKECDDFYNELILFALSYKRKGILDSEKIATDFNMQKEKTHPNKPIIPHHTFKSILSQDEDLLRQYIV